MYGFDLFLSFVFHIWRFVPSMHSWSLNFPFTTTIWKSQKKITSWSAHDLTVGVSTCMVTEIDTGSSMQDQDLVWKLSHQHDQPPPAEPNTNAATCLLQELGHVQLFQVNTQGNVLHMHLSYQVISSSRNQSLMFLLINSNCIQLHGLTCTDTFAVRHGGRPFRSTKTDWETF